jgi:arylsulfatase A
VHTRLSGKRKLVEKYKRKPGAGKNKNNPVLAAMIESIDEGVGRIMEKLAKLDIDDRTVVVFMSDNGGEHRVTSNAPLRGGKSQLYEGGIREPMIVRWPGHVRPGSVCNVPVSTIDFYPTFLEIAGAKPDPKHTIDGESLAPLLGGADRLKRDTLYWHYPLAKPHFLGGESSGAVRQGDYKLIAFYDTGALELYNLADDVGERNNLAATMPKKAAAMHRLLTNWCASVGAKMSSKAP